MSHYADYIRERTNKSIIETEAGFVVYLYTDKTTVYIEDIFITKDNRNKHLASELADKVILEAKERGCTKALGSVVPSANGSTTSLKVLLAYGMTLDNIQNDFIILRKEIV